MRWRWFPRSKAAFKPDFDDYQGPLSSKELLETPRRQAMVKMLWDTTSLTRHVFDEYLLAPIERYAELVQLLPASESHHHSYAGGMLEHALEMACYGLRLRQHHLLPPGAKPEDQSSEGELWSAAVIYGALMHDVAKVLVDMDIHLVDGRYWRLWHGNIPAPYRVRYRQGRDYHLHRAVNPLLCQQVLGPKVLDWLMSQPKLFSLLMYSIAGHQERGGIIADLIHHADRASVAKAMGGNPMTALQAPVTSIQRKLVDGLRHVIKQRIRLNEKGAQGYLTQEALWIVTPLVPRELKAHLLALGIEGIPSSDTRLYDEMQAHGLIEANPGGKSVWKCDVVIGDWKASFSLLKLPPAVIWGSDERPAVFEGEVIVTGAAEGHDTPPEQATGGHGTETASPSIAPAKLLTEGLEGETVATACATSTGDSLEDELIDLITGKGTTDDIALSADTRSSPGPAITKATVEDAAPSDMPLDTKDAGMEFWTWLQQSLANHELIINDAKAHVHTVNGTFFLVSPRIFKRYCNARYGKDDYWKHVQDRFQKLKKHHRTDDGKNIFHIVVKGPSRGPSILKGYLIKEREELGMSRIPLDNPFLKLKVERGKEYGYR
ncbi:hypothetical protein L861_14340 [Litchfieldella anticariensis FP35 = DSM 16096]|uniref:HD/PDEase domain-containing protein n=1 Tax=Litchfieldella anticariensis (strain DSM 16096 / CECT 5854 / CIP 108499 / LMG 22089 / FP35) TaxID=1121939 RepID=S2KYJ2_LITA3|nr:MobH family relaxase [Halomonas anticariensis]EPC00449.1 hypothetical protein L861_14340 [Halomonas anticariensis FP35 = DSM 16096]